MRPLAFTAFAVFAAAALAAAPLSAEEQHHRGGGGAHHSAGAVPRSNGGGNPARDAGAPHGHRGADFAAPALIFGLGAAAIAAGIAGSQRQNCGHYERIYDDWGNYQGRRWVDEC